MSTATNTGARVGLEVVGTRVVGTRVVGPEVSASPSVAVAPSLLSGVNTPGLIASAEEGSTEDDSTGGSLVGTNVLTGLTSWAFVPLGALVVIAVVGESVGFVETKVGSCVCL